MLTITNITDAYNDDRWLGFGYLGARDTMTDTVQTTADKVVVKHANARGWTPEVFFEWLNSKSGRWFGDTVHGPARWTQRDMLAATDRLFDDIESWMPTDVLATLTTED
jgi:hypothetical protein